MKPYAFHQVMRSLFVPLRLATDARGLQLEIDLDPNIDRVCLLLLAISTMTIIPLKQVARQAAYEAIGGESMESIEKHIEEHPDVDGMVTGDETRLRQIITNLARWIAFFLIFDFRNWVRLTVMRVNLRHPAESWLLKHD
jgi:osomolarity two-component system sensor histidine kinase SLN1